MFLVHVIQADFNSQYSSAGGGNVMYVCLYQKSVFKVYRTKGVYCRFIQYVRISVFA